MPQRTSPTQREAFYRAHQTGETYATIAERHAVSLACVRYWCRKLRAGGVSRSRWRRKAAGLLSQFPTRVRYWLLRLKLAHPRRGPNRLRHHLRQQPQLIGQRLPSEAQLGRYLHQWSRFRRPLKRRPKSANVRPSLVVTVHQRWQVDFKLGLPLRDGTQVNLCTLRDPVGEVCIGAQVFPAGRVGQRPRRVQLDEVQAAFRQGFRRWGTLPDEIQTDGEPVFSDPAQDGFPGRFRLWLVGLGITPVTSRPATPTDQAEVERCHRTLMEYAVIGNEAARCDQLQTILEQAVDELAYRLSARAAGCHGLPPVQAHPDLLQPRRPFQPAHELIQFDLARVEAWLATLTWERQVGTTGQICLGGHHHTYSVGRAYAGQRIQVRFDPADRHFVFYQREQPEQPIGHRPARHLSVSDLTGLAVWPLGPGPQQLPLALG